MFSNVVKHEVKALKMPVLSIFGIGIGVGLVLFALSFMFGDVWRVSMLILSGLVVTGACLVVLVYTLYNYYQSLHGRRAYLTMTLPVKGRTLFGAHTLVNSTIALIAHIIPTVAIVSLIISGVNRGGGNVTFGELLSDMAYIFPGWIWALWVIYIILGIVEGTIFYESILTIGNRPFFANIGKIAGPIVAAIIIYVACQVVGLLLLLLLPGWIGFSYSGDVVSTTWRWTTGITAIMNPVNDAAPVMALFAILVVVMVALAWLCVDSLEKRVTLR